MAATKIKIKRHDTEASIRLNGNLTGSTVRVIVALNGVTLPDLDATITDPTRGIITFVTADLEVGVYQLEVEVNQGGPIFTFPNSGYAVLIVGPDLG